MLIYFVIFFDLIHQIEFFLHLLSPFSEGGQAESKLIDDKAKYGNTWINKMLPKICMRIMTMI